ncbi:MAG: T9SS type A sorting domain-containing protein, partial [Brumimicrobium sp.]
NTLHPFFLFFYEFFRLNYNDVEVMIHSQGGLGFNTQTMASQYEVPVGGQNHVLYGFTPSWIAVDNQGSLSGAHYLYEPESVLSGPISNDYSSTWQNDLRGFISIDKSVIQDHIANHNDAGYTIPSEIMNWPGNGNIQENNSDFLAPYVDMNNNNQYDPENGDYPIIYGDRMLFTIFNYDSLPQPNLSNNEGVPIEVQMGTYQFASSTDEDINTTTFVYYKVLNKSTDTIHNFQWGHLVDFDIGLSQDDFFGTDVSRNLIYGYNESTYDPGGNGAPGYGDNPPAAGIISLNHNIHSTNIVNDASGNYDVNNHNELYNIMNGNNSAGVPNTDDNNDPTNFLYYGNPNDQNSYSEFQMSNTSGDRRNMLSLSPIDLAPGESECYHFAIVYKKSAPDHIKNIDSLMSVTDNIQNYFDTKIMPDCTEEPTADINVESLDQDVTIYPNPTQKHIHINSNTFFNEILIQDITGKTVLSSTLNASTGLNKVDVERLEKGVYFIKLYGDNNSFYEQKFIKQ